MQDGSGRKTCLSELSEQIEHFGRDILAERFLIGLAQRVADARRNAARLPAGGWLAVAACAVIGAVGVRLATAVSVVFITFEGQTKSPAY